jgi:hypothetical protein
MRSAIALDAVALDARLRERDIAQRRLRLGLD